MATIADLSQTEVLVLMFLCGFANSKTGQCNPSQATLADRARVSRQTVVTALNGLESKGYIVRQQRFRNDGGKAPCSYIINDEKLPKHPPRPAAHHVNEDDMVCQTNRQGYVKQDDMVRQRGVHPMSNTTTWDVNQVYINQELEPGIEPGIEPEEQRGAIAPAPTKVGEVAKARKPKFDPKGMTVPDALNFEAWCEFVDYRASKRQAVSELAAKKAIKELTAWPHDVQQQMVDKAIASDWRGVHPIKVNGNQLSAAAKAQRDIDMMEGGRLLAEAAMRRALKRKNG